MGFHMHAGPVTGGRPVTDPTFDGLTPVGIVNGGPRTVREKTLRIFL